jgi:arylsulfatase A-like enzyme
VSRRLPPLLVAAALLVAATGAGLGAWREARSQGWLDDGLLRLALDEFWRLFDPWAAGALGAALVVLLAARLLGRWRPAAGGLGAALAVVAVVGLIRLGALWLDVRGPGRPNLVLISIDTLRADHLGAYGYVPPTSPAFDHRLADESVVFENVLSQSPKTTPSHMTLLTSLYPSTHGISLWDGTTAGPALSPRVDTLAEVLRNAGYATAAFTGGAHMHRSRGFGQGFQRYRHADQLRRAREWLRAKAGRSFFLFFHTYQVHDPYAPPPELIPLFDREYGEGPILDVVRRIRAGGAGDWEHGHRAFWDAVDESNPRDVRYVSNLYDAGIRHMDDGTLTALLGELDALGVANDTLVVFTSDHGEAFGEHGRFLHDDLNGGTLHVPLVLRFPGRLPAGKRIAQRVELVDVMPTILELLDVPAPPDVQGASLVGLIRGEGSPGDDTAISEYSNPAAGRVFESIRRGSDALIRDGDQVLLFDLASDPGERHDRAAADPARVASLRAVLDAWRARCAALAQRLGPRGTDAEGPDAGTLRKLRALGYVE